MEELFGQVRFQYILTLIPLLILIYKGICMTFGIGQEKKVLRNLIGITICAWSTYNLVVGWNQITATIDTFLLLYFGSSGILDLGDLVRIIKGDNSNES